MAADSEFVFDAVVGFLTSPIWNVPVVTFIEQNCLVFDPDGEEHETYKELHEDYKHLVETLLSSFLKDIGITAEQFTNACKARGGSSQFNDIHKNIFEQVWAAEDFEVFKRLMIQKNIELQLQALKLIEQRGQMLSHGDKQQQQPPKATPTALPTGLDEEDAIMQEVLRLSKEEYDKKSMEEKREEEELEKTLAQSSEEHESPSTKAKAFPSAKETAHDLEASKSLTKALEEAENALELRLQSIAQREQEEMEKALKSCIISQQEPPKESNTSKKVLLKTSSAKQEKEKSAATVPTSTPVVTTPTVTTPTKPEPAQPLSSKQALPPLAPSKKSTTPADAAANWMSSAKAEASASTSTASAQAAEMTESEIKRRTEYLKQQRDKLLQMKKSEREKKLHKYTEEQPKARPTSARAARRVTAGERVTSPSSTSPTDEKKLAMRRALADVLKREVIDKQ